MSSGAPEGFEGLLLSRAAGADYKFASSVDEHETRDESFDLYINGRQVLILISPDCESR